ncbi:hypothetical protein Q2T46_11750 [Thermoanaerobacterium sp. CMT5567-10]|uniref:phage tail assembly chaperone n=1 Tax=Thermoanaerobacterium sp. CMT5567-10 TaxID=3061989 RepID=UPI0026DF57E5|nr:hypothetical protein [Thermoanaerobacterium sp. CMT5567-10]WKV08201.1 hypothetical protein Q2T46_11750 [Thermoanaerobacterium sp. CMT5567-10]
MYENMTDDQILERLLSDTEEIPQKTVFIKRLGIPITLKALTEKQIARIREKNTYPVKNNGIEMQKFDDEGFKLSLIVACTVKPDLTSQKLLNKYKVSTPEEFVARKFLAGEIEQLVTIIYELNGYANELEEIEELKN